MDNYILLNGRDETGEALKPECVLFAANRIGGELGYKGSFVCLPAPVSGAVILVVTPAPDTDPSETERLFRSVAFDMNCPAADLDGNYIYADSDDNDTSFLEHISAPEEEIGSIWLRFSISNIAAEEPIARMRRLFDLHDLDIEAESDGLSVYISHNGVLDIFYNGDCDEIDGEIDTTYAGAGVYVEAFELASELAKELSGKIEFAPVERITYPVDRDFNKLRSLYYESLRQQLVFAFADDRDGLQAYIGWGVDSYELVDKLGTIVTYLGRYNIDRIISEIEAFGFEAVADQRFLVRNYLKRGADEYMKTALSLFWTALTFKPGVFAEDMKSPGNIAVNNIEEALRLDPYIRIPKSCYYTECAILRRPSIDSPKMRNYHPHYEIGYLCDKIYYGFGSYLRKFKLDGSIGYTETVQGELVFFNSFANPSLSLECRIEYFDGDAQSDDDFFTGFETIHQFDIGGTAFCRCAEIYGFESGVDKFKAKAEILIRDERYTFNFSSDTEEILDEFIDTISGCRAVEDIDDLNGEDIIGEKPRAWGACFYRHDDGIEHIGYGEALKRLMPLIGDYTEQSAKIEFYYDKSTLTASKFGGVPYRPEGFETPVVECNEITVKNGTAGMTLDFIAQVNFEEFESLPDFPEKGILQLYALVSDNNLSKAIAMSRQVYYRVLYFEDVKTESINLAMPELRMRFKREQMNVTSCDYRFEDVVYNPFIHMTGELSQEDFNNLFDRFYVDGSRIGGYPIFDGNDRRHPNYEDLDTLLLQIDSEEITRIVRPSGKDESWLLNLFINREALIKRDFSKILLIIEKDIDTQNSKPKHGDITAD